MVLSGEVEGEALLAEDFDGGIDAAFDGVVGRVEDGGTVGDYEGGGGAVAIGGVAFGDGVDFAGIAAAGGADVFCGVDVEFEGCVGEDDGADVAAFHNDGGAVEVVALEGDEFFADGGDGGDGGDVGVDGLGAEGSAGIEAVDGDG